MGWLRRLRNTVRRSPADADLEEEVRANFASRDGRVLTDVALGVAATAFIASWLPAWRAAALNPVVALRED